jgi:hypothetical protein
MPPPVFETAIPEVERLQAHALDRAGDGTDRKMFTVCISVEPQDLCMI